MPRELPLGLFQLRIAADTERIDIDKEWPNESPHWRAYRGEVSAGVDAQHAGQFVNPYFAPLIFRFASDAIAIV